MKTPPSTIKHYAVCTVTRQHVSASSSGRMVEEEFSFSACVRGYYIYKDIQVWIPTVGEKRSCARQMNNNVYRNAVSDNKEIYIVGLMQ